MPSELLVTHERWEWSIGFPCTLSGGVRAIYVSPQSDGVGAWVMLLEDHICLEAGELAAAEISELSLDLTDDATAGVLLGMLTEQAPRRVEVHAGGEVASVRIRMLGVHHSKARGRVGGWSFIGATLGDACAQGLLEVWGSDAE